MEIRQLELFVAAAEEQHFTRAAERCNIVQSGLSSAIRALEEEMGASLFIRSTRRVDLSPAGQIFLPEARRVLSVLQAAERSIKGVRTGVSGRIVVSMVPSLVPALDVPFLLQEFRTAHPNVEISVRETRPGDLCMELRRGSVDVAFMPSYAMSYTELDVVSLVTSEMAVVGAWDHRWVGTRALSLETIAEHPFVDVSTRWGLRKMVDQIFTSQGIYRTTAFEVDDFGLLLDFVERGFGLAMIPKAVMQGRSISALDVTLKDKSFPVWELGMYSAKRKGRLSTNPAADLFRDFVRTALKGR